MSKYITDGKMNISDLRHDVTSLLEPMSLSIRLTTSESTEKAVFLQQEILKNLKKITEELNAISNETRHL